MEAAENSYRFGVFLNLADMHIRSQCLASQRFNLGDHGLFLAVVLYKIVQAGLVIIRNSRPPKRSHHINDMLIRVLVAL